MTSSAPPTAAGRRRRPKRIVAYLLALAALALSLPVLQGTASAAGTSYDMKLLVVSADGTETDFPAIKAFLSQVGVKYDVLVGTQQDLTSGTLQHTATHGKYQGIVLTTGNLIYTPDGGTTWQSAFTTDEWNTLRAYQAAFGVRSVTSYTFPEAAYGLSYVGVQDTLGSSLPATLTTQGKAVFPYMTGTVPLTGAWAYYGTIIDPTVTTPLLSATINGQSYPIASVTRYPAGYENLAITVANNPNLIHSLTLSYGWVNWVTKGQFLGSQTASMNFQIDDLWSTSDVWNPATRTSSGLYRNTPGDITALVAYQNARKADPITPGFMTEWAYNAETANVLFPDALTRTVLANKSQFGFINHTYTHFNLDCGDCANPTGTITTTRSQIQNQISRNTLQGTLLGLPLQTDTMVQPDISGINTPPNPMAQKAAGDLGIRYWIGDTSRVGIGNPSFNTGFPTAGDPRVYVVPRHASNLFYSVTTPAEWVSMYNHFYGPGGALCATTTCFSTPQTYAQILDRESDYLVRYWLSGDLDPMMYHIGNARAYDGKKSTMTDVIDAGLAKYKALVKSPIKTQRFKAVGVAMQDRAAYDAAGVTATLTPCASITLKATNAAKIPVTGVSYTAAGSSVSTFGGRTVSTVTLKAGQSVTIPLPAC